MFKFECGTIWDYPQSQQYTSLLFELNRRKFRGKSRRIFYHKLALVLFQKGLDPWFGAGNEGLLMMVRPSKVAEVSRLVRDAAQRIGVPTKA